MDKYDIYDSIINRTITNIYTLCKDNQEIIIKNFDFNDENDLYFLEIIKIVNNIFGFKVAFKTSFLKNLYFKTIKKMYFISPALFKNRANLDITKLKSFMSVVISELPEGESFKNIYQEYYKKG